MENNIKISILIPTYNREKYLPECLDSVINQEGFNDGDIEIIIGDNASTDNTELIIKKYQTNYNNIKYYKSNKNIGPINNFNKLLDLSKGYYFIILSDDDKFYDNSSLLKLYNGIIKYNLDACYGKSKQFYKTKKGISFDINFLSKINQIEKNGIYINNYLEELIKHSIGFGGVLYKKYLFKYNSYIGLYCDWFMNLEYLKNNKKIGVINDFTFLYRKHNNQSINSIGIFKDLNMYFKILKTLKVNFIKIFYLCFYRFINLIKNNLLKKIINISKKINLYSYLSPLWRKYILNRK